MCEDYLLHELSFLNKALTYFLPSDNQFVWTGTTADRLIDNDANQCSNTGTLDLGVALPDEKSEEEFHRFLILCGYSVDTFSKWVCTTVDSVESSGPLDPSPIGHAILNVRVLLGASVALDASAAFLENLQENSGMDTPFDYFERDAVLSSYPAVTWKVPIPNVPNLRYRNMRNLLQAYLPDSCEYALLNHHGDPLNEEAMVDSQSSIYLVPIKRVHLSIVNLAGVDMGQAPQRVDFSVFGTFVLKR